VLPLVLASKHIKKKQQQKTFYYHSTGKALQKEEANHVNDTHTK